MCLILIFALRVFPVVVSSAEIRRNS
jgi:hypothetical protein